MSTKELLYRYRSDDGKYVRITKDDYEFEVEQIFPEEFIRRYAAMITNIDALRLGCMLSIGEPIGEACAMLFGMSGDRIKRAIGELETLGYIRMRKK